MAREITAIFLLSQTHDFYHFFFKHFPVHFVYVGYSVNGAKCFLPKIRSAAVYLTNEAVFLNVTLIYMILDEPGSSRQFIVYNN